MATEVPRADFRLSGSVPHPKGDGDDVMSATDLFALLSELEQKLSVGGASVTLQLNQTTLTEMPSSNGSGPQSPATALADSSSPSDDGRSGYL